MTFLAPMFLLFGLTASVPLVLHLYRQRQRIVMPFSTSRFFTQAIIRAQRRMRIRRILLLLLRMAACLLIALAIAQPILRGIGGSARPGDRDVVIVLDDSLSMQAADAPRPSRFDLAKRQVVDMLRELSGGDRAALITSTGRSIGDGFSDDPQSLIPGLNALQPAFAAGDPDASLQRSINLLDGSRHRRRLVVVVSDLQSSDWPGTNWTQPHEPLDLVLYKIGDPPRDNIELDSVNIGPGNLVVGQPASLTARIVNHSAAPKDVTLKVTVDGVEQSRRPVRLLGGGDDVETVPLEFDSAGQHRVIATVDPLDGLPADNTLYATIQVRQQMPVLVVDGQSSLTQGAAAQRRGSAAFYLRAAMLASGDSEGASPAVRPDLITPAQLAAQSLDGYRVVILSAVRSLPQSDWQKIAAFTDRGGGVAVFLGDDADPSFYNDALKPIAIGPGITATTDSSTTRPIDAPAMHVHQIEQGHPLFDRFTGETRGALLSLSIYRAVHLDPGSGMVLASLDNNQPLAVEREIGKGKLIVWATSPVPASTNLPLRRAFIPLMGRMISHLAGDSRDDQPGSVGHPIELPIGKFASGATVQIQAPGGAALEAQNVVHGVMAFARLAPEQVSQPGFYQMNRDGAPESDASLPRMVAVNRPRNESSTTALEQADIDRAAGLWHTTLTSPDVDDPAAMLSMRQGWSGWWDSLLWFTLAVVLFESIVAGMQTTAGSLSGRMQVAVYGLRAVAVTCVVLGLFHVRYQSQSTRMAKPILAVMLDDSKSMSVPSGTTTRYEAATEMEKRLRSLATRQDLVLFDAEGHALNQPKPQPTAGRSTLVESIASITRSMRDRPLKGIVMLSDGIDTDQRDDAAIDSLGEPVYPIEIASPLSATAAAIDLSIDAVNANDRALVGNLVRVVADISARGAMDQQAVAVSILQGDKPVRTKLVSWPKNASSQRVEIEFSPLQSGKMTYAIQAGPVDGEKNLDDNRKFFSIDVRAKPINVMYIDGVLRWEAKFLRDALSSDPDINLLSSVRTLPGSVGSSRGLLLPEQLAKIDVVILGDVDATFFTAAEIEALRAWVTERGGGLLLTGGYRSFGPQGLGRTELRQILPVEFSAMENPQVDQPFNLRLTDIGQEHPIFSFSSDPVRDTRFVQSLPRLDGCSRIAAVKPGAEVLAVNPRIGSSDGGGLPVMITQQVGAGRAMVFTVDTTWRWRLVVGGFTGDASFYNRFWGQIVRWLARGDNRKNAVALDVTASRASVEPNGTVEIQARIGQAGTIWRVSGNTIDATGATAALSMTQAPDGSFRAKVQPTQAGRFDVLVTAQPLRTGGSTRAAGSGADPSDDSAPRTQQRVVTIQVEHPDIEMLQTTPDPMWLRKLAQRTGGQYLKPADVSDWVKQLPQEPVETSSITRIEVWRSPILVAIFLAALCAEWIVRRRSLML